MNHCNYTDAQELEITTIENVIYIGMKNDASFLLHGHMVLYEHQYTYNPNLPLRGLLYIGKLYQKYIENKDYNIYGSKLIKIPAPQYVVFYNGDKNLPDRTILKLSEAFERPVEEGRFEWTATMLNINYGKNQELMEHCQTLKEYAIFIDKCKSYIGDCASVAEGINKAVDECILVNVLKEFLVAHRGEVLEVLLTEFDEEKYVKAMKKEGYDEGYKKNIKCMVQMALEYGEDLETAVSKVSEKLSLSIEEVRTAWEESEIS